jgi:hypothetical protein
MNNCVYVIPAKAGIQRLKSICYVYIEAEVRQLAVDK